jgi:hypothetical protein
MAPMLKRAFDVNNRVGIAESWFGRSLLLALVLVTAALGFCLLDDANHDGHGCSSNLCLSLLSTAFASGLLAGPLLEGWATDSPTVPVRSAWVTVLAPPPRSL